MSPEDSRTFSNTLLRNVRHEDSRTSKITLLWNTSLRTLQNILEHAAAEHESESFENIAEDSPFPNSQKLTCHISYGISVMAY